MPSYRVERCFFVVKLYTVVPAPCAGRRYLGDRSGISVTESFRCLQHKAIRSPIDDATQVGKGDTGIFPKNPLGRYPQPGRAFGYLVIIGRARCGHPGFCLALGMIVARGRPTSGAKCQ
jgi:hypothetical protein